MKNRIGVDLGGTKIEIMLTGSDPLDVIERHRVPTEKEDGYQHLIEQLSDLISSYVKKCSEPPTIGVGIPGSINAGNGNVRGSNTVCLNNKPLKKDVEALVGLPVHFANDADCFALSEAMLGAGKGHKMVFGVIMGTGCGGGIILDGKLWTGRHGSAGEWGHLSLDFNGRKCWCGAKGCMETYLSGPGVEKEYTKITGEKKNLKEIYQDYKAGSSPAATQAMTDLFRYFGIGMSNLINAFDPDIIILGGGVSNIPELYTEGVKQVKAHIFNDEFHTPIVKNQLGDSSGIFGTTILAGMS